MYDLGKDLMVQQSLVCIIAIVICVQVGLITNLAPFDPKKGRTCKKDVILVIYAR
jgi:GDP-mannose transporter